MGQNKSSRRYFQMAFEIGRIYRCVGCSAPLKTGTCEYCGLTYIVELGKEIIYTDEARNKELKQRLRRVSKLQTSQS